MQKKANCVSTESLAISGCCLRRVLLNRQMMLNRQMTISWLGRSDTVSISLLHSTQLCPPSEPAHTCCSYFLEWMFHFSQDSLYVFLITPSIKGLFLYLVHLRKVAPSFLRSAHADFTVGGGCSQEAHLRGRTLAGSHLPSALGKNHDNNFSEVPNAS